MSSLFWGNDQIRTHLGGLIKYGAQYWTNLAGKSLFFLSGTHSLPVQRAPKLSVMTGQLVVLLDLCRCVEGIIYGWAITIIYYITINGCLRYTNTRMSARHHKSPLHVTISRMSACSPGPLLGVCSTPSLISPDVSPPFISRKSLHLTAPGCLSSQHPLGCSPPLIPQMALHPTSSRMSLHLTPPRCLSTWHFQDVSPAYVPRCLPTLHPQMCPHPTSPAVSPPYIPRCLATLHPLMSPHPTSLDVSPHYIPRCLPTLHPPMSRHLTPPEYRHLMTKKHCIRMRLGKIIELKTEGQREKVEILYRNSLVLPWRRRAPGTGRQFIYMEMDHIANLPVTN